jgi:hypothetical protein
MKRCFTREPIKETTVGSELRMKREKLIEHTSRELLVHDDTVGIEATRQGANGPELGTFVETLKRSNVDIFRHDERGGVFGSLVSDALRLGDDIGATEDAEVRRNRRKGTVVRTNHSGHDETRLSQRVDGGVRLFLSRKPHAHVAQRQRSLGRVSAKRRDHLFVRTLRLVR